MSDLEKKYSETQLDHTTGPATLDGYATSEIDYEDKVLERRILRKIDIRLIPWLSLLYLLSFLDRTNIGNANLFGLSTQLHLNQTEYSTCLAIFFAFYVLFEVPSNMVLKAWRPSMWLSTIMVGWGIVITTTGVVHNYSGLFAARVFLGITEAGLFPGVTFFLTQWYRRHECASRTAIFFSAATIAGAFGGLLARLINLMDGVGGLHGWRWIFILEGILTVVIAVASYWMLYDYPDTAKFLDETEKRFVVGRLALDHNGLATRYDNKFAWQAVKDWKVWAFSLMYIGTLMPLYSFSLFSPTIIKNLGYTAATAQLLSVPPYVLAAFMTIGAGFLSDRFKRRGVFVIAFSALGLTGFAMNIGSTNAKIRYAGVFLGASGIYPCIPLVVAWAANSFGGSLKRAVGMAIVISVGNAGGVISSYVYRSKDAPRFYLGHGAVMGFIFLMLATAAVMIPILSAKNSKKEKEEIARGGRPWSAEERKLHEDEGDDAPFFYYTL
ncbi:MFS general substrate transporter [Meredithblackwellia eburnea MCA 4105]